MKILFLGDINDVHLIRWASYFSNKGHKVHIASFEHPTYDVSLKGFYSHHLNKFDKNGYISKITAFFKLGSVAFNPISLYRKLNQIIKKINPDVIHAHSIIHHSILGSFMPFYPYILTAWGSDVFIYPQKSAIVKYFVTYALKRADLITCDGENVIQQITKFGIEESKVKLIYHGTDVELYSPHKKYDYDNSSIDLRKKYALSDGPIIISTRKLSPVYDIETLIKAIPIVLNDHPLAQFIIVGWGEQKEYLENLVNNLGVGQNVLFTGIIPSDDIPFYLANSDIYVSTALSDGGLAASTAEAMSSELPVLITDFGDNKKWVEQSNSGYLFQTKNYTQLASLIIELLSNPNQRTEFGKNGRNKIENDLNYYKEMEKMENIYYELLTRK